MNKKIGRGLFALLLAGAMALSGAATAFAADASLTFGGANNQFVFDFASGSTLIEMERLMPGDTRVQTVDVKNNYSRGAQLYVKALPAGNDISEISRELLDRMTLSIKKQFGAEAVQEIYRGPLSGKIESAFPEDGPSMLERIYLGELPAAGTGILEVTIEVPIEFGNEFQGAQAQVVWEFTAENHDEDVSSSSTGGDDDDDSRGPDVNYIPGATILDAEVPLANGPVTTIDENQVPLGSLPKTGS